MDISKVTIGDKLWFTVDQCWVWVAEVREDGCYVYLQGSKNQYFYPLYMLMTADEYDECFGDKNAL